MKESSGKAMEVNNEPRLNFYEQQDWPGIYAFFKKHLREFDVFYQEFNEILITLVD